MQSWVGGRMKEFRRAHSGFDCWLEFKMKSKNSLNFTCMLRFYQTKDV